MSWVGRRDSWVDLVELLVPNEQLDRPSFGTSSSTDPRHPEFVISAVRT